MSTYQGTFADISYDGKIIRVISKNGMMVHPILPEKDSDRQFYIDFLEAGENTDDLESFVNDIVADEAENHPKKMAILLSKLGKTAFIRDWTRGDKVSQRPN